ncbi:MAG: nicotinate (nicotinamide) nucleotide adenylyltransferase [Oscillatoriales cyanobacterium]|uniref:nicotinate (nicotinamide) nucleotide adenylyltransferase n=1 Tax=Microcoleus sp. PH2017_05_CCC_O_A TaxID=2798816 RepID=UPI001D970145|nr:nicotinate (nicotinamide) nucleotide adenylyltransferase [Microcoleus sp. PH2017_05_CCC_O_A]MCC3439200.1 nicotinate (nicotinamide) nucleotide adenylyltransferase [Microcoleus sp. PH2017_05_CCC_O_A]TAF95300.1 MAG: nicotinate (nicotinamide) nucleotide adenylyltransferase [Oscillatoriales cyanobacterium]TAG21120.1 MAG: nicotinate (nicotinamide) nucleotide adenylyltransferase [Oscillatoriales cyanobacterium]TAG34373.1 MAG: nicotinate (nicotinamide) nucleotide adenylyltransferase [Oscillatoriales
MGKIAIFGGTFDPVHWGHLLVAQAAASQFNLDRVIWVPDRAPPHKWRSDLASFDRRRSMLALALGDRPDFLLAPLEANSSGSSFAIDTLLYLQKMYPGDRWYWIIGSDAFRTLPKWHRSAEIGRLCHWLVGPRPSQVDPQTAESGDIGAASEWGDSLSDVSIDADDRMQVETNAVCCKVAEQMALLDVEICWEVLSMRAIEISSSHIRRCWAQNRELGDLVPEVVGSYIAAHQLYQQPAAES